MDLNFLRSGLLNIGLRSHGTDSAMTRHSNKCLFLDRDGVVIKERNYLRDPSQVQLETGVQSVIKTAKENDYLVFIVTNQSGIERGYFGWDEYERVSVEMCNQLGQDHMVDGIIAWGGACESNYRKPNGNMLRVIKSIFNINMKKSILIGDKLTDLLAGKSCEISLLIQTQTGHGQDELHKYRRINQERDGIMRVLHHDESDTSAVLVRDLSDFESLFHNYLAHELD